MTDHRPRNWLITGVSTGFGRAFAREALSRGDRVAGTLRRVDQIAAFEALAPGRAFGFLADVTDGDAVAAAVDGAVAAMGGIDVLVNNAGYGHLGGIEEATDAEARRQMDVNLFGLLEVTRRVLPHMRAARRGHVFNISSVGGVVAFPGVGIYNASKFAVEAVGKALASEVAPHGIKVTNIEPGAFRTDWAGRSARVSDGLDAYAETAGARASSITGDLDGTQPGDPARAAILLADVALSDDAPLRLPFGEDAVDAIRAKLTAQLAELDAWEARARDLEFAQDAAQ